MLTNPSGLFLDTKIWSLKGAGPSNFFTRTRDWHRFASAHLKLVRGFLEKC